MKRLFLATACIAWTFGCPSSDDDVEDDTSIDAGKQPQAGSGGATPSAGHGGDSDAAVSGSTAIVGHFNVKLTAPIAATATSAAKPGSTSVSGKVYDAPLPSETVWDLAAEAGDCKLVTPRAPFCDPQCVGGVCVEDDQCQENPTAHSLGTLHVTGLTTTTGATEFDIKPINNGYMNGAAATLPYPAFDEGDSIGFSTSGGDYASISATVKGIAPLALIQDTAFALAPDKPLALAWAPAAAGVASRIQVELDISHHGGSKGKIECESADSGSLEIAASLISKLIDLGVAGFPTVIVTRRSVANAQIAPGVVEFAVSMYQERAVGVPGVASCTSDDDCEDGKDCQTDLTCQ